MQQAVIKIDSNFKFAMSDAPYRALTALAGLYAHAEKMKRGSSEEKDVADLISSLMQSLGVVYGLGETLRNDLESYGATRLRYAGSVCNRIELYNRQVNFWTPVERILRIIYRSEGAWIRSLKQLILGNAKDDAVVTLLRASVARRARIEKSLGAQTQENYTLRSNYAKPISLLG